MSQDFFYWQKRPHIDDGDWLDGVGDWVLGYWHSVDHPHRQLVIDAIKKVGSINSVVEVGCSSGPNLVKIKDKLLINESRLAGIDANKDSISFAQEKLLHADLRIGNCIKLPWDDGQYDCLIADAVGMYFDREKIGKAIKEWIRIAKRMIIIIDRYNKSPLGVLTSKGHIWARNYERLLLNYGLKVEKIKLTEKDWPTSKGWVKDGYLWIAIKL